MLAKYLIPINIKLMNDSGELHFERFRPAGEIEALYLDGDHDYKTQYEDISEFYPSGTSTESTPGTNDINGRNTLSEVEKQANPTLF